MTDLSPRDKAPCQHGPSGSGKPCACRDVRQRDLDRQRRRAVWLLSSPLPDSLDGGARRSRYRAYPEIWLHKVTKKNGSRLEPIVEEVSSEVEGGRPESEAETESREAKPAAGCLSCIGAVYVWALNFVDIRAAAEEPRARPARGAPAARASPRRDSSTQQVTQPARPVSVAASSSRCPGPREEQVPDGCGLAQTRPAPTLTRSNGIRRPERVSRRSEPTRDSGDGEAQAPPIARLLDDGLSG